MSDPKDLLASLVEELLDTVGLYSSRNDYGPAMKAALAYLRECAAPERGEAQPVAWITEGNVLGEPIRNFHYVEPNKQGRWGKITPLYAAAPAAPEGFTREQMKAFAASMIDEVMHSPAIHSVDDSELDDWLAAAPTPGERG